MEMQGLLFKNEEIQVVGDSRALTKHETLRREGWPVGLHRCPGNSQITGKLYPPTLLPPGFSQLPPASGSQLCEVPWGPASATPGNVLEMPNLGPQSVFEQPLQSILSLTQV